MSKKKNKKKHVNEYEEQMSIMNEINNIMLNGGKFNIAPEEKERDEEEYQDPLDLFRSIEADLEARYREEDDDDDDYEPEPVSSVSEDRDNGVKKITVRYKNDDVKIVEISDSVKTVSIDINALDPDDEKYDYEEEYNDGTPLYAIAKVRLVEILTNFYPNAFLTKDVMNEKFWNVSSMNEQSFYFMKSFFDDDILFGYYIPEESLGAYEEVIEDAMRMNKLRSFLTYIYDATSTHGFAFGNLGESYIRQLMMLTDVDESSENFINMILDNDDTVIDSSLGSDVEENGHIPIYPFYFKNDAVDAYINAVEDEDEDDEDDEEEVSEPEDEVTPVAEEVDEPKEDIQFNVTKQEPEEAATDEVMNDEPSDEATVSEDHPVVEPKPFNAVDELKAFDPEFEDLFDSEEESDEPPVSVKGVVADDESKKSDDADDGEFIVKRRL